MDRLTVLEIFVKVIEEGSFTDAAQALGISKSHCSKQVRHLEDRLNARLVNRTTRHISPTDVGRAFYARCIEILESIEEAERTVGRMQNTPTGTLRLNVPLSFGVRYISPAIAEFLEQYPDLKIDAVFDDRRLDVIEEGHDLTIRIGNLNDSSLIARKLAPSRNLLCASPKYLERHGEPKNPRDLRDHRSLLYRYLSTASTWHFARADGTEESIRVNGPLRADNGDALVEAASAGLGVLYVPDFLVVEPIQAGRLKVVMHEWCHHELAVWAVYPHARHLATKVRLFIDFLVERFSPPPWNGVVQA